MGDRRRSAGLLGFPARQWTRQRQVDAASWCRPAGSSRASARTTTARRAAENPTTIPSSRRKPAPTGATFQIPAAWNGRDIHIVFEAAMTDTTVTINGQSAGPTHQGGFYRFSYDITQLVKPGRNEIEVRVSKESANKSVNHAERRGDYWTFGGIYRPVWLEARPPNHIVVDRDRRARRRQLPCARASQSRRARRRDASSAQVFDAARQAGRRAVRSRDSDPRRHGHRSTARSTSPALWTAETPNLYSVKFTLESDATSLHERRAALRLPHARSPAARWRLSQRPQDRAQGHQPPQLRSEDRPHADARAELRRRAPHQGRQHERGAHVALSTRSRVSRSRGRARASTCSTNSPAGRASTTRPPARGSSARSCAAT